MPCPGTLQSQLIARGHALLREFASGAGIALETTGALVVAWDDEQHERLETLLRQAVANGYQRAALVGRDEVYAREPHLAPGATGGLVVPDEAIIDPWSTVIALVTEALANNAVLLRSAPVVTLEREGDLWTLHTPRGALRARFVVNAAGSGAPAVDRVAGVVTASTATRRGEFVVFDKPARKLVPAIVLPAGPGFAISPTVFGNVLVGPSEETFAAAVDTATTRTGIDGLLAHARQVVPPLGAQAVITAFAGVRPAPSDDGDRFMLDAATGYVSAGDAGHAGFSASMAIAEHVVGLLGRAGFEAPLRSAARVAPVANLGETAVRPAFDAARIAGDPEYGRVVCHCESVSRGELRDACGGPVAPVDLDGLRRRTRAMMGRCQGSWCSAEVMGFLARPASAETIAASAGPARRGRTTTSW